MGTHRRLIMFALAICLVAGLAIPQTKTAGANPELPKIVLAQGTESLLYGVIYVARAQGYFQDEGLMVETVIAGGGANATAAVIGGSAFTAAAGLADAVPAAAKGQPLVAFAALMNQFANRLVLRSDVARAKGITGQSPLAAKIDGLKGLKIGITSPGSQTDAALRYILSRRGINPDRDVEIVPLRNEAAALAAIKRGAVDGLLFPSPAPDQAVSDGSAVVLIDLPRGELPELRGFLFLVLVTSRKNVTQYPQTLLALTKAVWKAEEFLHTHKPQAAEAVRGFFKNTAPKVFDLAFESNYPAYPLDPTMSVPGVDTVLNFLRPSKKEPITVSYYQIATNRFVDQARTQLKP